MIHPLDRDLPGAAMIARVAWEVRYRGVPAHAAASPHEGVNALDAVRLAMNGMDALRQQVPPDVRMHAIISEGGDVPNIIPHRAALKVYLRAARRATLHDNLLPRMRGVFEGAAMMTGAEVAISEIAKPYDDLRINHALAERFSEVATSFGRQVQPLGSGGGAGSTDLGNVSYALPCLHGFLAIDDSAKPHTPEFAAAARSERGERTLLDGAGILATMGAELLGGAGVMERVREEHAAASPIGP
jgi:metal-dependent amidase/aminoacylase/carboxypeptidase family protein